MISAARRSCVGVHEARTGTSPRSSRTPSCFSRRTPRAHRVLVERRAAPRRRSRMRSGIGMRARRRAIGGGAGYDGSQICSLWTRRISISSRWPSVTSRPVGAPFISIIVLSAVVVPCTRMSSSRAEVGEREAEAVGELREPVHDAGRLVVERGRRLVEHDLAVGRHADEVGERPADVDPDPVAHRSALTRRGRGPRRPARARSVASLVDREREVVERAGEHDAVVALGALDAHVLVEHVVEHRLRVAVERVAPAATAAVVVHDPLAGRRSAPSRRCAARRTGRRSRSG